MANLAIFDLDYTLTQRGTWGRFVFQTVKTRPWLWLPLLISAGRHQWLYKKGRIPRIAVKQAMMRWSMVGKPRAHMLRLAEAFATNEVPHKLRPGAIRALIKHRDAGDVIIIASAAVDIIVEAIARHLEIEHWVATDMAWQDESLLPEFASKNCYGAEKLVRVKRLFDENPKLKQSDTHITFYSDSHSDIEMFTFSDVGIAVNPNRKLQDAAPKLGIEVIDWNK